MTEKNIVNTVVLGFRGTKSIGIYSAFCSESLKEMSSGNNNNNKNKNKNKVQTTRYKQQGTNNKVQTNTGTPLLLFAPPTTTATIIHTFCFPAAGTPFWNIQTADGTKRGPAARK